LNIFRGDDTGLGEMVEREILKLCARSRLLTSREEVFPYFAARGRNKRGTCNSDGRRSTGFYNHKRRRRVDARETSRR
jgi:hypothetical protein